MIGRKLYYEKATGDVILITPEKHSEFAINTTKEQDFQMYDVLHGRNPMTIGVIQLEYGQYREEFQLASSVKVNSQTKDILFNYPKYETSFTVRIEELQDQNIMLQSQLDALNIAMAEILGV